MLKMADGKIVLVISEQAQLPLVMWRAVEDVSRPEKALSRYKARLGRAKLYGERLTDWAVRVGPVGDYLRVARHMYKQSEAEVKFLESKIEECGKIMEAREG